MKFKFFRKYHFTLKKQIVILMLTASILLFIVQIFYIFQSYRILRSTTVAYADSIMQQLNNNISTYIDDIIDSTQAVVSNSSVQRYLRSEDSAFRYSQINFIKSFINYIISSKEYVQDIAIVDANITMFLKLKSISLNFI